MPDAERRNQGEGPQSLFPGKQADHPQLKHVGNQLFRLRDQPTGSCPQRPQSGASAVAALLLLLLPRPLARAVAAGRAGRSCCSCRLASGGVGQRGQRQAAAPACRSERTLTLECCYLFG